MNAMNVMMGNRPVFAQPAEVAPMILEQNRSMGEFIDSNLL